MATQSLRIVLSGMVAGDPHQGGATWAVLQYLIGLRGLGHTVCLVEPMERKQVRPEGGGLADSVNARYFGAVMRRYPHAERAALLLADTRETAGSSYAALREFASTADVLINVSGLLTDAALIESIPVRVYLDLDPAFNQLWHAVEGIDRHLSGHTHFATVADAIGRQDCMVPDCGVSWIPTLPPVVLSEWPVSSSVTRDALTTVGNWRAYGSVEYAGVFYGQKAHSMRRFFELPSRTREAFLLALAIHPDETRDLEALAANGWTLCDPAEVAGTPWTYHDFIQGSRGEFGIAKSGYVHSRCGWFSDRSVCYLASGRPVLAQETGFSRTLPVGLGLLAFSDVDEAAGAVESLRTDYRRHRRAAREIAQAYFDSTKVLDRLLERVGGAR